MQTVRAGGPGRTLAGLTKAGAGAASRYEPTGGDGRYSRLYLRDLEPSETVLDSARRAPDTDLVRLAQSLDEALADGDKRAAESWIRCLRAYGRVLAGRADDPPAVVPGGDQPEPDAGDGPVAYVLDGAAVSRSTWRAATVEFGFDPDTDLCWAATEPDGRGGTRTRHAGYVVTEAPR
jgi:hypothetical protein